MPRHELSDELRKALKNRRVIGDLTNFYDEIDARSQGLLYEPEKKTVDVQFPLRPDFEIRYTIPADMTAAEAGKLSAHFETIYFQETGRLPAPEGILTALDKYVEERSLERSKTLLFQLIKTGKLEISDAAKIIDVSPQTFEKDMETYATAVLSDTRYDVTRRVTET